MKLLKHLKKLSTSDKSKKKEAKDSVKNFSSEKKQTVEIPFCSHKLKSKANKEDSRSSTPLMTASNVPTKETPTEPNLPTASASTSSSSNLVPKLVLNPEEKKAAEDILRNLVEIRDKDKHQPDPVLDTMIRFHIQEGCQNSIYIFNK